MYLSFMVCPPTLFRIGARSSPRSSGESSAGLIWATTSLSSGFHPQTNGQAGRANQIVARILRSLAYRNSASWSEQLAWAEYAHNSLPSSATGLSPFHCCLGYQPPLFLSQDTESNFPSVQAFISRCKRTWNRVRSALCRSRRRMSVAANRHRAKSPRYVRARKCGSPLPICLSSPSLVNWIPVSSGHSASSRSLVLSLSDFVFRPIFVVSTQFSTSPVLNLLFAYPLAPHAPPFVSRVLPSTRSAEFWTCAAGVLIHTHI